MNTYQISEYRINLSVPSYIQTTSIQRKKKKTSPFTIPSKDKISLINLTIELKDSYKENLNIFKHI